MTYTKTDWKDHVVDNNTGAVIQQGTPVSAKNLNNIEQGIGSLYEQLEASKVQQAKIPPGVSVINTDQGSDIDLAVYGITRANIINPAFDCNFEADSNADGVADGWVKGGSGAYSVEASNTKYGNKSQRVTALADDAGQNRYVSTNLSGKLMQLYAGKYYVGIVDAVTDGVSVARLNFWAGNSSSVTTTSSRTLFAKLTPVADTSLGYITFSNYNAVGVTGWVQFDGAGVYEVDKELYDRIGVDITEANIRDYLPYVDGKQFAQGVVITKEGKNLLPAVPNTFLHANFKINGPYDITLNATDVQQNSYIDVNVVPGQTYTLSGIGTLQALIYVMNPDNSYGTQLVFSGALPKTFTVPIGVNRIRLVISNLNTTSGALTFKNWQLEAGSTATLFEPTNPQRLILPGTLAEVGGIKDELMVKGTEVKLIRRVQRDIQFDGQLTGGWGLSADQVGFKAIYNNIPSTLGLGMAGADYLRVRKYDGNEFKRIRDNTVSNTAYITTAGTQIVLTVPDTETGWAEDINPNTNAIKAFMNGWKANANDGSKYTSWVSIVDGKAPATNTEAYVAANKAPGWTAYASADYALATPEVKPINNAEGAISLHPGVNQMKVETGLILMEKVTPTPGTSDPSLMYINAAAPSQLSKRAYEILNVYKNNVIDPRWNVVTRTTNNAAYPTFGRSYATVPTAYFDPNEDYYVTYLVLDKYAFSANVIDASCTYGANTKTVLDRTVRNVAELDTKAMVLTRSVAELYKKVKALGG